MTSFFIAPIDIDNLRLYNIYTILGIWENMRKLEDKNTGLVWILPEVESVITPEPPLFPEDKAMLDEFTKELNQYQSAAITRFVTGNCANLGDFLVWVDMDNRRPCYCFEDGKLVAAAVIDPNNALDHMNELVSYIKFCEHSNFSQNGIAGYISYKKAKEILKKATSTSNTNIDYLVVVPPAQNKGVGTRAVSSITHNMDFFAPNKKIETVHTQIHKANTPSQVVFHKNNFYQYALKDQQLYDPLDDYVKSL